MQKVQLVIPFDNLCALAEICDLEEEEEEILFEGNASMEITE